MPETPSCCAQAQSVAELCPDCLAEWEQWMEQTAMPTLRKAMARDDARTQREDQYAA